MDFNLGRRHSDGVGGQILRREVQSGKWLMPVCLQRRWNPLILYKSYRSPRCACANAKSTPMTDAFPQIIHRCYQNPKILVSFLVRRLIIVTWKIIVVACPRVDHPDARKRDTPYWLCPPSPTLTSLAFATSLEGQRAVGMTRDSRAIPSYSATAGY